MTTTDHRTAPSPSSSPSPPPPAHAGSRREWVVAVVATSIAVAVIVPGLAIAGFVVADRINEDDPTAFDDVTIEQCSTDACSVTDVIRLSDEG